MPWVKDMKVTPIVSILERQRNIRAPVFDLVSPSNEGEGEERK